MPRPDPKAFVLARPLQYTGSMRVYLESLGCRLNYAEMSALGRQLVAAGHQLSASADQADLCVLNSCAVTDEAARKSRQTARQLAQRNPGARLVLTGCYATLEGSAAGTLPNVSLVVGNPRKEELASLIEAAFGAGGQTRQGVPSLSPTPPSRARTRAFVKVQDGCRNRCTFCIVTAARGDERSRPIPEVVEEVAAFDGEGCQEVVLTGVHLGAYGRDRGETLQALLRALLARTQIPRLRLSSLEPFDLTPAFFDLWAESDGRLMPHLHLPAQAGSDAVLRRMARLKGVAGFESLVESARVRIPGLTITTDLIAGFPGERESDFAETIAFARRVGFAHLHVFPYSARKGTAAARFGDQVAATERRCRSQVLRDLDFELGQAVRRAHVGETRPVLWEHPVAAPGQRSRPDDLVSWSGLTDNYLRVFAAAPADVDMHNRITMTSLVAVVGGELWGEPVV